MAQHKGKKTNRTRVSGKTEGGWLPDPVKNGVIGAGAGLLCALVLLFPGTGICLLSPDPISRILPVGLATLYLSALFGGLISTRKHKSAPLLCGGLCGGLILVVFWVLSLFVKAGDPAFSSALALLLRALIPLFSVLGAMLGTRKKPIPRKKRR